jgi:hypothetical protein
MNNKQWEDRFDEEFETKIGSKKTCDDIKNFISQREAEIRKETIKAVLPEEKDMPVADENFFIGYNTCRELIKDKAKSKFNITI